MARRSKIARLPAEIRSWLHQALAERAFGDIAELTAELNKMLGASGIQDTIGKSAVGVESQRIQRLQESIRATTEAARQVAEAARDDEDKRSEAVMAVIQSDVWDVLVQLREAEQIGDPVKRLAVLTKVAKSVSEMSRARVNQSKWRTEIEARARAAAETVTRLARRGGADAETIREIRASILGITKREQPPADAGADA